MILTPRGGNQDSCDCTIFFLWHSLSADKLLLNLVAGQRSTVSGTERGTDHTGSWVQQTEQLHLWSHISGCGRGGEGQEGAEYPGAPYLSPNPAMRTLQVPLDPLVFVGGAVGDPRKKHRLVETHMKLIPKWSKGVSFLQKESGQRLTEGEGKPTGDGAKELWLGNSGRFYSSWNTLVRWPIGMSVCNSWPEAREGQFHLQSGF